VAGPQDKDFNRLVQTAADLKPSKLRELLVQICKDDDSFASHIRNIAADTDEQTPSSVADWAELETTVKPGEMIGPYEVLGQLGEGGMGVVVKARQTEPIERTVALKVIKAGMSSKQVLRRFQMEQQTLAAINHPYIAQVYDAGVTHNKRPYFAMEFIEGTPLTELCDTKKLDLNSRLDLFGKVLDAIRYAHQRGIVHRDLKPANILVVEAEGAYLPKIIDFGIAKALHTSPEAGQTMLTAIGTTMGSPGYMSPEQARTNEVEIDTRSDIYSLGIILFELVTGFLPDSNEQWRLQSLDEILDVIINKPAPKPSDLLKESKAQLGEILPNRATSYNRLYRAVKGDLDWIILKALEKDKTRRYETASEFQSDIESYLQDMPVIAGPPGLGYQIKKFVQRHTLPVAAFTLLLITLVGGIIGTTQGFLKARKEAQNANQTLTLLQDFLTSPTPEKEGHELKVIDLLDKFSDDLPEEGTTSPEVMASLKRTLGVAYANLSFYDKSSKLLEESIQIARERGFAETDEQLQAKTRLAHVYKAQSDYEKALPLFQDALKSFSQWYGEQDERTLLANYHMAMMYLSLRDLKQSEPYFEIVFNQKSFLKQNHPATYYQVMHGYSEFLRRKGEIAKGIQTAEEVLEYRIATHGEDHVDVIRTKQNLSNLYFATGDYQKVYHIEKEALASAIRVYGDQHRRTAAFKANFAATNHMLGHSDIALKLFEEVYEYRKKTFGIGNVETLAALNSSVRVNLEIGNFDACETLAKKVIETGEAHLKPGNTITLDARRMLGLAASGRGQYEEALDWFNSMLTTANEHLGELHTLKLVTQAHLAQTYRKMGAIDSFIATYIDVHNLLIKKRGPEARGPMGVLQSNLRECLADEDRTAAQNLADALLQHYETTFGKDSKPYQMLVKEIQQTLN
jgi:serine/threonine protein kinase